MEERKEGRNEEAPRKLPRRRRRGGLALRRFAVPSPAQPSLPLLPRKGRPQPIPQRGKCFQMPILNKTQQYGTATAGRAFETKRCPRYLQTSSPKVPLLLLPLSLSFCETDDDQIAGDNVARPKFIVCFFFAQGTDADGRAGGGGE